LTLAVAPLVEKVIAFEIERRLEKYWGEIIGNIEIRNRDTKYEKYEITKYENRNIEIVWGNAIKNLTPYTLNLKPGYKVLANLPYSITSNVLRVVLESENKPEQIILMVQKEVAERICAKPGDMSLLAVSVQYYGEPKIICRVAKGSFWPSPKVDSAIIKIEIGNRKLETDNVNDERFFEIVKAGFANKRKQLWRNLSVGLKLDGEKVKAILREVCGNEIVRAQELGVGGWKRVMSLLGVTYDPRE